MRRYIVVLAGLALGTLRATAQSPALSLREALAEADRHAFAIRMAASASAAQRGIALAPLRGILPSVRVEAGIVRTTDPIGAFGATMRQRSITAANFDPRQLNHPAAVTNFQGGLVVEQPLVDLDAWAGRRAALSAAGASRSAESWTRLATRTEVIRAYYGAILAAEQARTLQAAVTAARAHLRQAESLVRNGVATKSDALLASVRASEIDAQLLEATGATVTARHGLSVVLGRDGAETLEVGDVLPASSRIREITSADTAVLPGAPRADVTAAARGLDAARADVARARATLLPRLNSFARYDWYSADRPYAGEKTWTVGLMASWSLFAGASELSDVRSTAARADAARAAAEAAQSRAALELERTRIALSVALARLEIAERAVTQSGEAHRIVTKKYESGLATIAELLDAHAVTTKSELAFSQARFGAIVAGAERRQALGADPATLASLDDRPMAARDSSAIGVSR